MQSTSSSTPTEGSTATSPPGATEGHSGPAYGAPTAAEAPPPESGASPEPAANLSYKSCDITNGQIFSCSGSWYQGKAVVQRDGSTYHECDITNGQVFSCSGSWYQGKAVVFHNGAYHECDITNGRVFSCNGSWYQGKTVVLTDR